MLINYSTIPTLNRWIAIREQMVVYRRHDTARRSTQMPFFDVRRSEDIDTTLWWVDLLLYVDVKLCRNELSHVVSVDVQVSMFASGSASLFVSADPVKSSIRTCRFWTPNLRLQMHRLRVCLVSRLFDWNSLEYLRAYFSSCGQYKKKQSNSERTKSLRSVPHREIVFHISESKRFTRRFQSWDSIFWNLVRTPISSWIKGRKDRDSILTVNRSTVVRGRVAVQDGEQRKDIGTTQQKDALGEVEKGRGYTDKDGTYWFDEVSVQGVDMTGGGEWHGVSSNQWTPKLFLIESTTPGLELKNSSGALDETDSDDEVSVEDFPTKSVETVFQKKSMSRLGKACWQRTTSLHEVKHEVNGVQELYQLVRL